MRALLPALLVTLGATLGGLAWGTTWWGSALLALALASALAAAVSRAWTAPEARPDASIGRWAPDSILPGLALWLVLALSAAVSPTPRAALGVLALGPALIALPTLVARLLGDAAARRRGGIAIGAGAAALAIVALAVATRRGEPVAMPLGHHLLLATLLVALWPIGWQAASGRRGLQLALAAPAIAAVLGTRSLAALAALGLQALLLAPPRRRGWVALAVLVAGLGLAAPRLTSIAASEDPSLRGRLGYWNAGLRGVAERPLLGHGPGSTPWVIGRFAPGVSGELVGDLHALPLTLLFEAGVLGVIAAGWWLAALLRRRRDGPALAGVAGAAVCLAAGPTLAAPGPLIAAAVALGWALAPEPREAAPTASARWIGLAACGAALLALGPSTLASRHAERAIASDDPQRWREELRDAVRLDPHFPLWRLRLGLVEGTLDPLLAASEDAPGIAALHLAAGALAAERGDPRAVAALDRAHRLDRADPFAALLLALADPTREDARELLATAIRGDPQLLASPALRAHPATRLAIDELISDPSLPPGWREGVAQIARQSTPTANDELLQRTADRAFETSLSILLFHRRPWPLRLAGVWLDGAVAETIDVPPLERAIAFEAVRQRPASAPR